MATVHLGSFSTGLFLLCSKDEQAPASKGSATPVHGPVVFEMDGTIPAVIRLPGIFSIYRIRQVGVSEFAFPGATHTRFAHSIGVFHTARQLVAILKRQIPTGDFH
jgi:HD superfamily phosphohydrolase